MSLNPFIRAARTYGQTFLGLLIASWTDFTSVGDALSVGKSAALAAVPAGLSLLMNALEDSTPVQLGPKG